MERQDPMPDLAVISENLHSHSPQLNSSCSVLSDLAEMSENLHSHLPQLEILARLPLIWRKCPSFFTILGRTLTFLLLGRSVIPPSIPHGLEHGRDIF